MLKPIHFGNVVVDFPIIQAALSGYSDAPMRRLAQKFGAGFTLGEVLLNKFVVEVSKGSKSRLYLDVESGDHPCGAQLMGSEPEEFVPAALKMVDCGFDLIDLNFACPVKKVVGKNRGGFLMKETSTALNIARRVRDVLPSEIPLTVKLRRGFDDSTESEADFFDLLDGLIDCGIAGLTLHGRTVRQRYQGTADWDFLKKVKIYLTEEKKRPDLPLIGSGDLFSAPICLCRLAQSGVDGLALARGIIGNPWLFAEVRALLSDKPLPEPPTLFEQKAVLTEHYLAAEELYGERRTATEIRKFAVCYARRHPDYAHVKMEFVLCRNREMFFDLLNRYYAEDLPGVALSADIPNSTSDFESDLSS